MISLGFLLAASLDAVSIAQTGAALNALGPHPFTSPRNQAAAQFLAAKLTEAGLSQTTVQEFTTDSGTGANVLAHISGRTDRVLILATHHDTAKDGLDLKARSRSLATLVEIGRQMSKQIPAKTWILASFDGGASRGEGLAHYLGGMGSSRGLVDGVILLDAADAPQSRPPAVIAPVCAGLSGVKRTASKDFVAAALGGVPQGVDYSFDDSGIGLLTQPFLRAFKVKCEPAAAQAISSDLNALLIAETPISRRLLATTGDITAPAQAVTRDESAARLGELALAAARGADGATIALPQTDSWLVAGTSVWPGWLLFLAGAASLVPALWLLRHRVSALGLRAAASAAFLVGLYLEPEVALFAGLLPNLVPVSAPRLALLPALTPLALLVAAGAFGFARGSVEGSWLSIWIWGGALLWAALLFASMHRGPSKASGAKGRRKK